MHSAGMTKVEYREYCMCLRDKLFQHSQEGCFCIYFSGNKYQNNTRVSAETVCHESTHNTLFLTWHKEYINDNKNDDLYTSSPCLTLRFRSADDVTMTRQLWHDRVNSDILLFRYQFNSRWYSWPVV